MFSFKLLPNGYILNKILLLPLHVVELTMNIFAVCNLLQLAVRWRLLLVLFFMGVSYYMVNK